MNKEKFFNLAMLALSRALFTMADGLSASEEAKKAAAADKAAYDNFKKES